MTSSSRFLRACRLQPVDATPVWFMRQAGRYMSGVPRLYASATRCSRSAGRRIWRPRSRCSRSGGSKSTRRFSSRICCCRSSRWASRSTSSRAKDRRSRIRCGPTPTSTAFGASSRARRSRYVLEAIRQVQRELAGRVPLIGFAGAPFTLASYAIEGGHSNNFAQTKALMYGAARRLASPLRHVRRTSSATTWSAQIDAGVDAVQVFDSWVGALNAGDYREFILPHTRRIFDALAATRRADDSLRRPAPAPFSASFVRPAATSSAPTGGLPLDEAWQRDRLRSRHPGQSGSDAAPRARSTGCSLPPTTS